jgi:hypothetical protein
VPKKQIQIIKASGKQEPFSDEKVLKSLKRAGASRELATDVLNLVKPELYDGITTHEIYQHVFKHLRETGTHIASKYNLKRAIMELGPSGYPFEKFLAKVFESNGYQVAVGQQVRGKCVWHEVDVIAEKEGEKHMVEAKFHNESGLKTDTKVALYVYARFLDISSGDGFDKGWLVTNTKLTRDARAYCDCVGLNYMSWDKPSGQSLRETVERSGLYPVTALITLNHHEKSTLLGEGIVTCKELLNNLKSVPQKKRSRVKEEAQKVCSLNHNG